MTWREKLKTWLACFFFGHDLCNYTRHRSEPWGYTGLFSFDCRRCGQKRVYTGWGRP